LSTIVRPTDVFRLDVDRTETVTTWQQWQHWHVADCADCCCCCCYIGCEAWLRVCWTSAPAPKIHRW